MKVNLLIVLACLAFATGCESTRIAKTLVVAGVVLDAKTQKPIAGARVCFLDRKDTLVTTDKNGEFICGPGYMDVPFGVGIPLTFGPDTQIRVSAKGYESQVLQAYPRVEWTQKNQMKNSRVLVIRLQRRS